MCLKVLFPIGTAENGVLSCSCSSIFKRSAPSLSPEQSSTLLRWRVPWDTCTPSTLFTGAFWLYRDRHSQQTVNLNTVCDFLSRDLKPENILLDHEVSIHVVYSHFTWQKVLTMKLTYYIIYINRILSFLSSHFLLQLDRMCVIGLGLANDFPARLTLLGEARGTVNGPERAFAAANIPARQ